MTQDLIMLAVILAAVVASSFLASLIPGRPIPEVVFFVVAGAVLGPHCAGVIHASADMSLVSRLGMGFLFLIAGYDLDLRELMGRAGRHGAVCWAICMALAVAATLALDLGLSSTGVAAFAIALTTTAYGTLVPIMRDRELSGTAVGGVIESYGAMGELLPVVAMSLMLSPARSMSANVAVLVLFVAVCVFVALQAERARAWGSRLWKWVVDNAETSSQATLRVTVLLLVTLLALAAALDLDAVLAAFAAGFILRHLLRKAPPREDRDPCQRVLRAGLLRHLRHEHRLRRRGRRAWPARHLRGAASAREGAARGRLPAGLPRDA